MILVDTTPLVRLCDPRDSHHRRAISDLERFARQPLLLCEPVLTEAWFLLDSAPRRRRLDDLISELPVAAWAPPDAEAFRRSVLDWHAAWSEHEPDWADGYLVLASSALPRARLWTYDSEFRSIWRRPNGSRVPLATD